MAHSKPELDLGDVYTWEFQNTVDNRWYYIRDRAIRWIDSRIVRLEIATDITEKKLAEEKLLKSHERLEMSVKSSAAELLEANRELEEEVVERKRVLEALTSSNSLLENVFKTVNNLIAYMDRDFNFIRVNNAYATADGRDPSYFLGRNHFDLYPDEENKAIFRRVVEIGEPYKPSVWERTTSPPSLCPWRISSQGSEGLSFKQGIRSSNSPRRRTRL